MDKLTAFIVTAKKNNKGVYSLNIQSESGSVALPINSVNAADKMTDELIILSAVKDLLESLSAEGVVGTKIEFFISPGTSTIKEWELYLKGEPVNSEHKGYFNQIAELINGSGFELNIKELPTLSKISEIESKKLKTLLK